MIDQAGSTVSAQDTNGFSVSRLKNYGVKQIAAYSIDCGTNLSLIPGGPWYPAGGENIVNSTRYQANQMITLAHSAGLMAYLSSDIFQFPDLLLEKYGYEMVENYTQCIGYRKWSGGCIGLTNTTRTFYSVLFDELLQVIPGIDGVILRYGENSPCNYHSGNAPLDTTNDSTMISSLQTLLLFLREELCVKRNLTVIFRTWDTSTQYFHANATFYDLVTNAVPPHPKLVFSIKHTMLDFWRRVRFNPTIGVGVHSQVVEAEIGGMYGGCGTHPLYIGNGLINYYEEDYDMGIPYGLSWLLTHSPQTFAGILTNHQCTTSPETKDPWLWWRLEEAVIAGWSQTPWLTEAEIFDQQVAIQLGITDPNIRTIFRNFTLTAMSANLRIQTCEIFDVNLNEVDRPTANWLLWDGIGGLETLANTTCHAYNISHCEVVPWLCNNNQIITALEEKNWAAVTYQNLNTTAFTILAPAMSNETLAKALLVSVESGVYVSNIINAGWIVMLLGYSGDHNGGNYNVTAIRSAITMYDALWIGYRNLSNKYGNLAPGLMNDTYWQHPNSNVSGMRQSVDKYRGI